MSSDDMPWSVLLAAALGVLVLMAAIGTAEWWLARHWPLWLFVVVTAIWGIGVEMAKRAARQRKANRAKVRAAESIIARSRT
jgi:4-hydroxybenzoate polyprenyltransferase